MKLAVTISHLICDAFAYTFVWIFLIKEIKEARRDRK